MKDYDAAWEKFLVNQIFFYADPATKDDFDIKITVGLGFESEDERNKCFDEYTEKSAQGFLDVFYYNTCQN